MSDPNMFMLIYVREQPVRMIFHGNVPADEQDRIIENLNDAGNAPIRLSMAEKFFDSEFHYTIFTLNVMRTPELDQKLARLYPSARRLTLDKKEAIRDAVRSIVIM